MKVTFKDNGYNEETGCFESEFDYGEGRKSISHFCGDKTVFGSVCGDKTVFGSVFANDCRILHDKSHLRIHLIAFGLTPEEYNKILNEIFKGYEHIQPLEPFFSDGILFCPWCRSKMSYSWGIPDEGDRICDYCGKDYEIRATVKYETIKKVGQ